MLQGFDIRQRWLFENRPIRGTAVFLDHTVQKALQTRAYSLEEKTLLAEALLSAVLLGGIGKQSGKILLQFQGTGSIKLLSAQATQSGHIRAALQTASGDIKTQDLQKGTLGVIYQPDAVAQHYQSIVEAVPGGLIPSLEHYFLQSEQILTKIQCFEHAGRYAAFLWQVLPDDGRDLQEDAFRYVRALADTVTAQEVFEKPLKTLLTQLFHEDLIRLMDPESLTYGCEDREKRFENAVLSLGKKEAMSILDEHTHINLTCEFCGKDFVFDRIAVEQLFLK